MGLLPPAQEFCQVLVPQNNPEVFGLVWRGIFLFFLTSTSLILILILILCPI